MALVGEAERGLDDVGLNHAVVVELSSRDQHVLALGVVDGALDGGGVVDRAVAARAGLNRAPPAWVSVPDVGEDVVELLLGHAGLRSGWVGDSAAVGEGSEYQQPVVPANVGGRGR